MKDEEILIAKQKAMSKFPYYGPILARSRVEEDNNIPTMGINNRLCLKYNKQFFLNLNQEEQMILVTHEVMHPMADHHHRWLVNPWKGKASFTLANIAMDMEINQHLQKDCPNWFAKEGWTPEKMGYPEGKAFEYYLDMIMQDIENDRKNCPNPQMQMQGGGSGNQQQQSGGGSNNNQQNGSGKQKGNSSNGGNQKQNQSAGGGGGQGSQQIDTSDNNSEQDIQDRVRQMRLHQDAYEQMKQAIKDAVANSTSEIDMDKAEETDAESQSELQDVINECKEAMKSIGSEHGFSDIIRKIPPKKYDWRKVLQSLITNKKDQICRGRDKMTFTKVNRRMAGMNSDIIFSEKYSQEYALNIVVGIDVSGSMGELTTEMYSRLKTINSQMSGKKHITCVECDTDVCKVMIDFEPYQNTIESTMGGGTDMEAIPRWVEKMVKNKEMEEPDLIIIMTDNYVSYSEHGHPLYHKKTVVLSDNIIEDCPYKQYEVIIDR